MKKTILLEFLELNGKATIELDNSQSPKIVRAIIDELPIKIGINRWGDELYTDETPVKIEEPNTQPIVKLMDVAYWPEGKAICFFYGPTPISKQNKILPYSPVNIIGRIMTKPTHIGQFLSSVEMAHIAKHIPVVLR